MIGGKCGYKFAQMPVKIINHRESKVNVVKDAVRMIGDVRKMKKRIKITSVILAVFLIVPCLAGCGNKMGGDADVHVFYYTYSDTYISTVRSALDKALSAAGIKYQDHDSNNSQTTQTEQVQTAITKGAKMLVVNIVTTGSDDAANGIVTLAKNSRYLL